MDNPWWLTEQLLHVAGFFVAFYVISMVSRWVFRTILASDRWWWIFGVIVLAIVGFFAYQILPSTDVAPDSAPTFANSSDDLETYLSRKPTPKSTEENLPSPTIATFATRKSDVTILGFVALFFGIVVALAVALLKYRDWNRSRIHRQHI